MNESYESLCPEFTRPRANTCPTTTLRRPRPAEFSPDANGCVAALRVPSPPEMFDFDLSKRFKAAAADYGVCSPSASGLPDYIDLDHDLEASLFGDEPSASGASCSYLSGPLGSPGGGGAQKKKRRNPWGPETYAELISKAIESRPDRRATLQQIYKFIIGYNKFFRERSEGSLAAGWKNSIRHNLSLQAKFIKVGKTMENSKSSYWTIDEKANDKKAYVRRRCVTLDKQTEAAARRKLVQRRELFNQQQQQQQQEQEQQQQQLRCGETMMEQDVAGSSGAFYRTGSNASQGSSSARSEGPNSTTISSSVLNSTALLEAAETCVGAAATAAAAASPPASIDGHLEDSDEFEKARLELALLVAESCYVNSDYPPAAPEAPPTPAKVQLPPPMKPPLMFQPQQMLQRFSFEEFLNEQRRKIEQRQQHQHQQQQQQQPWRPPASPVVIPSPHFRGLTEMQQQQQQQHDPQLQQQMPQQMPNANCQMSPLQAPSGQLKHQIRHQFNHHQPQQQPSSSSSPQQLQHLQRLRQLRLLKQMQQQQQALQMQLQPQSQQQQNPHQQPQQNHNQHQPQQFMDPEQQHQERNSLLQQIQLLHLQQRDRSGSDPGLPKAPEAEAEAPKALEGVEIALESVLGGPIMDLCDSWPDSPTQDCSIAPGSSPAVAAGLAPQPLLPSSGADKAGPPRGPLENVPCVVPPPHAEGVAGPPQYFRFAAPAKAAQFGPGRTC